MSLPSEAERRAFHDLALRYACAADRREYAVFTDITTPEAVIAVHHGDPASVAAQHEMRGHEQIVRAMAGLEQYSKTMHVVANQWTEIDDETPDRARGETYCTAHHLHDEDGVTWDYTMYIRYQDRFAKSGSRWLFSERRLWVEFTSDRPLDAHGIP